MSSNRRVPRHQGVRYGPPRRRERFNDNGVVIGRLLGLGILLLTLGVLAAGALAFIGERRSPTGTGRAGSASTTLRPSASASALALATLEMPTLLESVAPPSSVVVLPTVAVSAGPVGSAPLVQVGAGFVTFGTRSDRQLRIIDPQLSFTVNQRVTWSAFLVEPANSADLRVQTYKLDGTSPTGERLISDDAVTPVVTGAQLFQRRIRPADDLDGPGIYVVRYVRGTQVLSEGTLEITP